MRLFNLLDIIKFREKIHVLETVNSNERKILKKYYDFVSKGTHTHTLSIIIDVPKVKGKSNFILWNTAK